MTEGKYKGRLIDKDLHKRVKEMLKAGVRYTRYGSPHKLQHHHDTAH